MKFDAEGPRNQVGVSYKLQLQGYRAELQDFLSDYP